MRNIELVLAFGKCLCDGLIPSGFLNHSAVKWYQIPKIHFNLIRGSRGDTQQMPSNLALNHSMELAVAYGQPCGLSVRISSTE